MLICKIFGHKQVIFEEYGNVIRLRCLRCGKCEGRMKDASNTEKLVRNIGQDGRAKT